MRNKPLTPEHVGKLFNFSEESLRHTARIYTIALLTIIMSLCFYSCNVLESKYNRSDSIHIMQIFFPDVPADVAPKDTIG